MAGTHSVSMPHYGPVLNGSMTTADQVAPLDPAAAAPMLVGSRVIGAIAVGAALLSATATFLVLSDFTPIAPVHEVVVALLLGRFRHRALAAWPSSAGKSGWWCGRAAAAMRARGCTCRSSACSRSLRRCPTILVAIVASTTLDRALDRFFSTRTRAMIEQSLIVANAYVNEHAQAIRGEIMAMAFDLGRAKPMFDPIASGSAQFFTAQANARGLSAAMMIHSPTARRWSALTSKWTRPSCCRRRSCSARSAKPSPRSRSFPKAITSPPPSSCTATTTCISMSRGCSIRAWCNNCARRRKASANTPILKPAGSAFRLRSR